MWFYFQPKLVFECKQCDRVIFDAHIYKHLRMEHGLKSGGRFTDVSPDFKDFCIPVNLANMRELFGAYLQLKCSKLFPYFLVNGCSRQELPELLFRHTREERSKLFEVSKPTVSYRRENLKNRYRTKLVNLPTIFEQILEYNQQSHEQSHVEWLDDGSDENDMDEYVIVEPMADDQNAIGRNEGVTVENQMELDKNIHYYEGEIMGEMFVCSTPPGNYVVPCDVQPIAHPAAQPMKYVLQADDQNDHENVEINATGRDKCVAVKHEVHRASIHSNGWRNYGYEREIMGEIFVCSTPRGSYVVACDVQHVARPMGYSIQPAHEPDNVQPAHKPAWHHDMEYDVLYGTQSET